MKKKRILYLNRDCQTHTTSHRIGAVCCVCVCLYIYFVRTGNPVRFSFSISLFSLCLLACVRARVFIMYLTVVYRRVHCVGLVDWQYLRYQSLAIFLSFPLSISPHWTTCVCVCSACVRVVIII